MHTGKASPLQKHSIGDTYPWTVVGTMDKGGVLYYIANLVTGMRDKAMYESSYVAHEIAALIAQGKATPQLIEW